MEDRQRFVPLSVRMGKREPFGETVGVPDYLWPSIKHWIGQVTRRFDYSDLHELELLVGRMFRLPEFLSWGAMLEFAARNADLLLDIVDVLIRIADHAHLDKLEDILFDVAHEYRVDFENQRLIQRVDDTVYAAYETAVSVQDVASEHLAKAWLATYSRDTNYDAAVAEATKAVEAVCASLVIPNDKTPSIGKMIRAIKDSPDNWECSLPATRDRNAVEQFAAALSLVNYAQSRHAGGLNSSREHSVALLLQAVTVVAWVRERVFRRVND